MGTVFRATRLVMGDEVAIKILHSDQNDPIASERFRREAQAAARLKHPNAVTIYDFGITEEGLQYLVMELVEGESLRQIIKRDGPLTPSSTADIIKQVCAALDEAHRNHIVHRDIKPDNIIINVTPNVIRVKVLDFGIAKLRDDTAGNLTQTGNVVGTPHYMSPEQCLGEELDSRSDIYSLGVVLYEMLAGVVPFNSPISTAVVVQHVNQSPPSLRILNASITSAVEVVVLRALQKNRDARPQTAGALALELTSAVATPGLRLPIESPDRLGQHASLPTLVLNSESTAAIHNSSSQFGRQTETASRNSMTKIVGVTVVVTLILVGLGGVGFRTLFGSKADAETNSSSNSTPKPSLSTSQSLRSSAPASPVSAPTPAPPVVNTLALTSEVSGVIAGWANAARAHDLDTQMTSYADTVDTYFKRRNVSKATIRADRAVAYHRYYKLDVQLSNMDIVFDQSGSIATATFDKAFAFEGDKNFSGSVRTMLVLTKFGSQWLITGERDLKVHYINH